MTLRSLINSCNLSKVFSYLSKIDKDKNYSLEEINLSYTPVVQTLLEKKKSKPSMPILVKITKDFDGKKFIDVCLLNPDYTAPKKHLKPWGGKHNSKNAPKGYYNCNYFIFNKTYAFGYSRWFKYIDSMVINEAKLSDENLLANILWNLTFHGFTEKKQQEFMNMLSGRLKSIKK